MIDRANDHYALDITRARTLLGWEPKRSLRETLPKMVDTLKADRLAFYGENDLKPSSSLPTASAEPAKEGSVTGEMDMKMDEPAQGRAGEHVGHGVMAGPGMPAGGTTPDAMVGMSSGHESAPARWRLDRRRRGTPSPPSSSAPG